MSVLPAGSRGRIERQYVRQGLRVAGVDEVGRGCLAGPVYAGVAILDFKRLSRLDRESRAMIRDSKLLSAAQREKIKPIILDISLDFAVAQASVAEIEALGIVQATFLAMRRAIKECRLSFGLLLIDGKLPLSGYDGEQKTVIKGDNLCYTIAAASILAKEARDGYMREHAAATYPEYGFDAHVGYGTKRHLDMIAKHGICSLHRRNFDPIRRLTDAGSCEQTSLLAVH